MYYHVSSLVSEGNVLTHETKNNREICEEISQTNISNYEDYLSLLVSLEDRNICEKTGRDSFKWACETIFESIRIEFYPDQPSRIWGIYLLDSFANAKLFLKNIRKGKGNIFKIDVSEKVYRFNMDMFTEADVLLRNDTSLENYRKAIELAHKYWQGIIEGHNIEYLIDAEITVGKKIQI